MDRNLNPFELKRVSKLIGEQERVFDYENEMVNIDENNKLTFDELEQLFNQYEAARGSDINEKSLQKYFEIVQGVNELATKDKRILKINTQKPSAENPHATIDVIFSVLTNKEGSKDFHKDLFTLINKADFFSIGIHEPYTIMVRLMVDNIWKDWG